MEIPGWQSFSFSHPPSSISFHCPSAVFVHAAINSNDLPSAIHPACPAPDRVADFDSSGEPESTQDRSLGGDHVPHSGAPHGPWDGPAALLADHAGSNAGDGRTYLCGEPTDGGRMVGPDSRWIAGNHTDPA